MSYAYTSTYMQNHNDTINKQTSEDFFRKICTSHFIVRVRKGLLRVLMWEGSWRPNKDCNILIPTLMAVSVVSFSFSRAAQPEAQGPSSLLDDGFLYCIWSPTSLQNSVGGPYHILSATSLDANSPGAPRALSAWCGFLYHISSNSNWSDFLSWPSNIIVQRPLNRPLNLWNGMFDRHQAEITVMQSLSSGVSVYECIMGFFTLSHFVSQARLRDFLS